MAVSNRYILHQLPVIGSMGHTVLSAVMAKALGNTAKPKSLPGPEIRRILPPRPRDLVRTYVRHVGGDPGAYRKTLPSHLFPQWGFPLATGTTVGLDYPLEKILNAGCRIELREPLPNDEPLEVGARLQGIDDNGQRALLHYRIVTGTRSAPEALVGHIFALVPLAKKKGPKKEPVRTPADAREIAFYRLGPQAGLDFAKLTGDFNPVHWIRPYARAFGFRSTILHGFATMARAMEGLARGQLSGAVHSIEMFDAKFTRPLLLPAKVGVYVGAEQQIYVGDAPGSRPYLEGTYRLRDQN
jgi:acyl dehydratase